ncbi:MAG: organic solvent ABC transporter ATP-binding protein, partial [Lentisphaerae bacterium]|nr:organic solvent ABC transporter ATP-binding protein [Lentisphaerota bacterium]
DWSRIDQDQALRLRAQIGRVFDWHGWVSNLDVIENITLAQRHHTRRSLREITEEAQALASAFNLPEVPRGRPAAVPHRDLRRAEWVRAFMGRPALVCLERPGMGVAGEHLASLARAVNELCARGGAALWLAADDRECRAAAADRLRRCAMQGEVLKELD